MLEAWTKRTKINPLQFSGLNYEGSELILYKSKYGYWSTEFSLECVPINFFFCGRHPMTGNYMYIQEGREILR